MVGLATDDVRTDWKRLKASGVEFIEESDGLRQHADRDLRTRKGTWSSWLDEPLKT